MKLIPNHSNYSINIEGTIVINNNPEARRKQIAINEQEIKGKKTGYMYVTLCLPPYNWKRIAVHRLVAMTYIDNPNNLPEVNHKDGNKSNNNVDNLEWITHRDNIRHSYNVLNRTTKKGAEHWHFGKSFSKQTKNLMSEAKLGPNHPKYKGYYVINGKRFNSANSAADFFKTNGHTIKRRCNNPKFAKEYTFVPI